MSSETKPTVASLRKLLNEVLPRSEDFDAFCLDNFNTVHRQFSAGMSTIAKQNILLEKTTSAEVLNKLREYKPIETKHAEHILLFASQTDISSNSNSGVTKSDNLSLILVILLLVVTLVGSFSVLYFFFELGIRFTTGLWNHVWWKVVISMMIYIISVVIIIMFSRYINTMTEGKPEKSNTINEEHHGELLQSKNHQIILKAKYKKTIPGVWLWMPTMLVVASGYVIEVAALGTGKIGKVLSATLMWLSIGLPFSCSLFAVEMMIKRRAMMWLWSNAINFQSSIGAILQKKGMVTASDVQNVPKYARSLLLQKYSDDHSDEVTFTEEKTLQYRKPKAVQDFLTDVSTIAQTILSVDKVLDIKKIAAKPKFESIVKGLKKLTYHLCRAIGSSEQVLQTEYNSHRFHISLIDTSYIFEGMKLPDKLPHFLVNGSTLEDKDINDLRIVLSKLTYRVIVLGLLFCDEATALSAQEKIDSGIKRFLACDVIVFSKNDYIRIISSADPQKSLRKLIIQHVDIITVSPFVIVGPTPENLFFGREPEIRVIVEQAQTRSHAIIGGRRVGKSSLLSCLHRVRLPALGYRTAYLDCSSANSSIALLNEDPRTLGWRPDPPGNQPSSLAALLASPPTDKPFVFLLDEVDKLVPSERSNGWPLFNALRALANSRKGQVVLSGERTLREALRDSRSPLFNLANEILLGPLDYKAVEELITRPMKQLDIQLIGERAIVDKIWKFSSGHPNVVQRLCHRLIERLAKQSRPTERNMTLFDVRAIISDPRFQEDDFLNTYWERATPLEKIITIILARHGKSCRLQVLLNLLKENSCPNEAGLVKSALDRLVDLRSILKRNQHGYEFAVSAFPDILANTTTMEDLLIVLNSDYSRNSETNDTESGSS